MARKIQPKLYISIKTQVLDFLNLAQNVNKMSFLFIFTKISRGFKNFTATGTKILKFLPSTPFDTSFENNCTSDFCLLLSFSKLCSVKQNNKLDGPKFPQYLTLTFQMFRNKKRLPKYLTDRKLKMSDFFLFLKQFASKGTKDFF